MFVVGNKLDGGHGIYCGRPTVLGNPYEITATRSRDEVCDLYATHFEELKETPEAKKALSDLLQMHKELGAENFMLLCWCAPKRCHVDTIAKYLNERLQPEGLI